MPKEYSLVPDNSVIFPHGLVPSTDCIRSRLHDFLPRFGLDVKNVVKLSFKRNLNESLSKFSQLWRKWKNNSTYVYYLVSIKVSGKRGTILSLYRLNIKAKLKMPENDGHEDIPNSPSLTRQLSSKRIARIRSNSTGSFNGDITGVGSIKNVLKPTLSVISDATDSDTFSSKSLRKIKSTYSASDNNKLWCCLEFFDCWHSETYKSTQPTKKREFRTPNALYKFKSSNEHQAMLKAL